MGFFEAKCFKLPVPRESGDFEKIGELRSKAKLRDRLEELKLALELVSNDRNKRASAKSETETLPAHRCES